MSPSRAPRPWRRHLGRAALLWGVLACTSPTADSGPALPAGAPPPANDPVLPYAAGNHYVYVDPETGAQHNDSPLLEFLNGTEVTCTLTEVTSTPAGIPEGSKALRFVNTASSWSAGGWISATPADLSGYNALVLHVLALPTQFDGQFRVKIGDANRDSQEVRVPFTPDGSWKRVTLSLDKFSGLDWTAITKPLILVSGDADRDDIFYVDYVYYTSVPGLTPSSAPTLPTFGGDEVVLFSDAPLSGATLVPMNWAPWSSAPEKHVSFSGNWVKKLPVSWVGYDLAQSVDLSGKSALHLSVWADGLTALAIKLVDFRGDGYGGATGDVEHEHVVPLTSSRSWLQLQIPLSVWRNQGVPLSDLNQLVLIGQDSNGTEIAFYYLDDLYFR